MYCSWCAQREGRATSPGITDLADARIGSGAVELHGRPQVSSLFLPFHVLRLFFFNEDPRRLETMNGSTSAPAKVTAFIP